MTVFMHAQHMHTAQHLENPVQDAELRSRLGLCRHLCSSMQHLDCTLHPGIICARVVGILDIDLTQQTSIRHLSCAIAERDGGQHRHQGAACAPASQQWHTWRHASTRCRECRHMPQRAVRRAKPRQHVWRSSQDLLLSHSSPTASIDRLHAGLHAMSHLSQAHQPCLSKRGSQGFCAAYHARRCTDLRSIATRCSYVVLAEDEVCMRIQ